MANDPGCSFDRPREFTIPAASFAIPYRRPPVTTDIDTLATWMEMPLAAAKHVMRLAWPDSTPGRWHASLSPGPMRFIPDAYICKSFYWIQGGGQPPHKLVVLALLPWALELEDMNDLVRCAQVRVGAGRRRRGLCGVS